jgi:hypothetical protein
MTKKKAAIIVTSGGFLALFSALGIYLATQTPRNSEGYLYKEHFVYAGEANDVGVLNFNVIRLDTVRIYTAGDTLVIDWPDRPDEKRYLPGLPPIYRESYLEKASGKMSFFDLQPNEFYSVYLFPGTKWEVWPGTKPGKLR